MLLSGTGSSNQPDHLLKGGYEIGNDITRVIGIAIDRSTADLALQQRMGLLPEWGDWSCADYSADFGANGSYLSSLMPFNRTGYVLWRTIYCPTQSHIGGRAVYR